MVKKKPTNWGSIIITVFISLIMIFSIFAIVLGQDQNSNTKYNGYKFGVGYFPDTTIQYYTTKINGKDMLFYNFPTEVESINVSQEIITLLKNSQIIITTFNPETNSSDLQALELAIYDLENNLDKPIVRGISKKDASYSLPILDCSNSTIVTPVLFFVLDSELSISKENNCIILKGERTDFLRLRDVLLYRYYGVIV